MFHFYLHLIFSSYPTCHLALPPVIIIIYNTSNTHLLFTLHLNSFRDLSPQQSHFFLLLFLLKCFTIYSCSFMSSNSAHILATLNWSLSPSCPEKHGFPHKYWNTYEKLLSLHYKENQTRPKNNSTCSKYSSQSLQPQPNQNQFLLGLCLASLLPKGYFPAKLLLLLPPISTFFRLFKIQVSVNPICIYIKVEKNVMPWSNPNASYLKNKQLFLPVLPLKTLRRQFQVSVERKEVPQGHLETFTF